MPDGQRPPLFDDIDGLPGGGQAAWVDTGDGLQLRLAVWNAGTRGTILIYTGRSEYIEKYGPTITRLLGQGFSVMISDWRGQGLSTRPNDDRSYGWIESYDQFQSDIELLLEHPLVDALPKPRALIAHSMGGGIGLRSLHNGLDVTCAVFSAPMWGIAMPLWLMPIAQAIFWVANAIGLGRKRVPFVTKPIPYICYAKFEGNSLTGDKATFDWLRKSVIDHPELGLGGPSIHWTLESLRETDALARKDVAPVPTLTIVGSEESIVSVSRIDRYHGKASAGTLIRCTGGQHEIFMETPKIQGVAWKHIDKFLTEHLPPKP